MFVLDTARITVIFIALTAVAVKSIRLTIADVCRTIIVFTTATIITTPPTILQNIYKQIKIEYTKQAENLPAQRIAARVKKRGANRKQKKK